MPGTGEGSRLPVGGGRGIPAGKERGDELFIRETMRRVRTEQEVAQHRLTRSEEAAAGAALVCCWRRLRVIRD